MVAKIMDDEEFVQLWKELGSPTLVAKASGMSVRRVFARRTEIEARHGIKLTASSDQRVSERVRELGYTDQDWTVAWDKTEGLSVLINNPMRVSKTHLQDALKDTLAEIRKASPKLPKISRPKPGKDPALLICNMSDLHFGGWSGGGVDAVRQAVEAGLNDAISRSSTYDIDHIHFVMGSDCLHVDSAVSNATSKGTPIDTDGSSWSQAFTAAKDAYIHCVHSLRQIAPVTCIHVGGNHDELSSWCLSQTIEAYFHKASDVSFVVNDHPRKYLKYGVNMIGYSHGDKVREAELPMVAAHEASDIWGATTHRYLYLGHWHQTKQTRYLAISEKPGVVMQWLRSPKPPDNWHIAHGFMAGRSITSFIHSKSGGQIAQLTINLS